MSSHAPDHAAILDALTLLGVPEETRAAFPSQPENLAFSFADAVIDSPAAIYTDWRFHPGEALNDVWERIYPHGVKGMIEEVDEETDFPKKIILQHAGVGTRYRIRIKDEDTPLHDILFALGKVLPAELQVFSLLPYEDTDSYLHIFQPAPLFAKVRDLLGEWFETVFVAHSSPLTFTKTGGNVKPKRNLAKNYLKRIKDWLSKMEPQHLQARHKIERILDCKDMMPFAEESCSMFMAPTATPEQRKKDIDRYLRDFPLPRRFFLAGHDMDSYASRIIEEGVVDVLESRPQGWQRIHLALQYCILRLHFSQEIGWKRDIDDISDKGGRFLALAWALGDLKVVRWLSEELIRFPLNFGGWKHTPLEPMLLQLYALWQGIEINWANYPKAKLGVYKNLFAAWNEPAKLPGPTH
jgi:hypothetical protein